MKKIMTKCFEACQNKLLQKRGMFDLLGFDFMIDQEMKVSQFDFNITGTKMVETGTRWDIHEGFKASFDFLGLANRDQHQPCPSHQLLGTKASYSANGQRNAKYRYIFPKQ